MAAITLLVIADFLLLRIVQAAKECTDGGGGAAHRSAHRGGLLSGEAKISFKLFVEVALFTR
jgi:hypothetical protein